MRPTARMLIAPLAAALALAATGCHHEVRMEDDVDLDFDFHLLVGPSDDLHPPYVEGSRMSLYVRSDDDGEHMDGWTVASSAPSVLALSDLAHDRDARLLSISARALSPGDATLVVRDGGGHELHRRTVAVRRPDRVALYAQSPLLVGRPRAEALVDAARVRAHGTATFLVGYFFEGRELHGNGALGVAAAEGLTAKTPETFAFERRDWLQLTPDRTGDTHVTLSVGGTAVADVPVTAVGDEAVASVRIQGMDESRAHKGEWLAVLAQAYDTPMRPIYGVDYAWTVDNAAQAGLGDLFRYAYQPERYRALTAAFGAVSATAMIHGGEGRVDSSNNLGCSTAPGTPLRRGAALPAALGLAALVAAAALRARRRRCGSPAGRAPVTSPSA